LNKNTSYPIIFVLLTSIIVVIAFLSIRIFQAVGFHFSESLPFSTLFLLTMLTFCAILYLRLIQKRKIPPLRKYVFHPLPRPWEARFLVVLILSYIFLSGYSYLSKGELNKMLFMLIYTLSLTYLLLLLMKIAIGIAAHNDTKRHESEGRNLRSLHNNILRLFANSKHDLVYCGASSSPHINTNQNARTATTRSRSRRLAQHMAQFTR